MRDKLNNSRNERMIYLGRENVKYIENAKEWCKNFRIEMVSYGLLAEMSNLPIGMHSISCQYATGACESMNLPWIIPDFIINNCIECSHHSPKGNDSWGKQIIKDFQLKTQEESHTKQLREEQIKQLRCQLRELPRKIKTSSKITEQQILNFSENLFSDDENEQKTAFDLLIKSAQIGADIFPPIVIDILLEQSLSNDFAKYCLPICVELTDKRPDLSIRLKNTALNAIKNGILPEQAAGILYKLKKIM